MFDKSADTEADIFPQQYRVPMSNSKPTSLNEDERDAMRLAMQVFEAFRAENPVMTLQLAFTFLLVAHDEGLGVTEYANKAGMPQSVMSRHIADLGEQDRHHEPGLGLVIRKIDVLDRRRSVVCLSPLGRAVAARIYRALAGSKAMKR